MGRRFASSPEMGSPVSGFSGPLYGVGSGSGVDVGPGRGVSPSEGAGFGTEQEPRRSNTARPADNRR